MRRIFKFPIPIADEFTVNMPAGSVVLTAQVQRGEPFMWVLVDVDRPSGPKRFRLAGTGHPIENEWRWSFVATFQTNEGSLVWHLFVDIGVDGDSYSVKPTVVIKDAS